MIILSPLRCRWTPLDVGNADSEKRISQRLERVLNSWENTPYSSSQSVKGVGVYCTAFVTRVLDELYRVDEPTPMNVIPHDVSMHCGDTARKGLRWFLRLYPAATRIWSVTTADAEDNHADVDVQPGDILITGPVGGGPGHAAVVGPRENTMWQAMGNFVHYTGFYLTNGYMLYGIYRFTDKERWI